MWFLRIILVACCGGVVGYGLNRVVAHFSRKMLSENTLLNPSPWWRCPVHGLPVLTAVLSGLMAWRFGSTGWLEGGLVFLWVLLALVAIDLETFLLPDALTLPLIWAGLLFNSGAGFVNLHDAVWGAVAGYAALALVYWLYWAVARREGVGQGDFKLLAALGAWLGWQALPLLLLIASLSGVLFGTAWLRFHKQSRHTPIPFGPFLALAGVGVMLWGSKGG